MLWSSLIMALAITGQTAVPSPPVPVPVAEAPAASGLATFNDIAVPAANVPSVDFSGVIPATDTPAASPLAAATRGLFQSDHEFDGFTGPFSNPVQTKDPRSLTEARFIFLNNWSRKSTPVIGGASIQVYALQLRLALTDRLQLFADKDGIVRLSPNPGKSVTGLANIAAGAKYVFYRDVENQTLGSVALQYEAPTGYANIFQNQGSVNLAAYFIFGKQFGQNTHALLQFGQNAAMNKLNSGYFLTSAHLDHRFGKFTPFYEANWFYYNQSGTFLPTLNTEGGGLIGLGAGQIMGLNYVTNAVGFKYDLTPNAELGVGYEFQLSNRTMLLNNMLSAQLILRY